MITLNQFVQIDTINNPCREMGLFLWSKIGTKGVFYLLSFQYIFEEIIKFRQR